MFRSCARIAIIVAVCMLGYASSEDAPKICGGQQKCSEIKRLYVLDAYKSAVLAQLQANEAQARLQQAMARYNEITKEASEAESQPSGTTYQPNIDAGTVVAQPPAPKTEPKQEKK